MRPKATRQVIESKVAREFTRMVNATAKSQHEIAREAGFAKSNIVTMLKQGSSKVPISRAVALARACDADPAKFMLLCLEEYHPEIIEVLGEAFKVTLTDDEAIVMETIRRAKHTYERNIRRRALAKATTRSEQASAKLLQAEYGNTLRHRLKLYWWVIAHLVTSPEKEERERIRMAKESKNSRRRVKAQ